MAKQKKQLKGTIALNRKALHDYFIEHRFEAGIALTGWEVKNTCRKAQLVDSYVLLKDGEAWLMGCHISPLSTVSTHVVADPSRTRKLLLNRNERTDFLPVFSNAATPAWRSPCIGKSIWLNAKSPWVKVRKNTINVMFKKNATRTEKSSALYTTATLANHS